MSVIPRFRPISRLLLAFGRIRAASVCLLPRELASATDAAIGIDHRRGDEQIIPRKWMPALAVSFAGVVGRIAYTPQGIYANSNRLDMGRIDAWRVSAKVVRDEFGGNDLNEQAINKTVRSMVFTEHLDFAVPVWISSRLPLPTGVAFVKVDGGNLNLAENAGKQFSVNRKSVRILVGHIFSLCYENVILPGLTFTASVRALFILPQVAQGSEV